MLLKPELLHIPECCQAQQSPMNKLIVIIQSLLPDSLYKVLQNNTINLPLHHFQQAQQSLHQKYWQHLSLNVNSHFQFKIQERQILWTMHTYLFHHPKAQ